MGSVAAALIESRPRQPGSPYVFPAGWGEGHFIGIVRALDRVCTLAGLTEVTPDVLRHTFASVAGHLNFSEMTIKVLSGHSPHGVTQGYVDLD